MTLQPLKFTLSNDQTNTTASTAIKLIVPRVEDLTSSTPTLGALAYNLSDNHLY